MKINKRKQRGATLVSWLIVAGLGITAASGVVKVAPYYVEFRSVKDMMKVIASTNGIKKATTRQVYEKIEKHLRVNTLHGLENAYTASLQRTKSGAKKGVNPFKIKKDRKSKRRILTVSYDVPQSWIGNLFFLIKFKHAVVLGEPNVVIESKIDKSSGERKRRKIDLSG